MKLRLYKRWSVILCFALLFVTALSGCTSKKDKDAKNDGYVVYYINRAMNDLVKEPVDIKTDSSEEVLSELLTLLDTDTNELEYQKPLIRDVKIESYEINKTTLTLHFSSGFAELSADEAVLVRTAAARTLLQVPDISNISIYVGDKPLQDSNGNVIGLMSEDSFIENPGSQLNSIQTAQLTLYFADAKGSQLVSEVQTVHYISSISIEKLIVEQLIAGPETKKLQATISSETKILNVTTNDNICYVNFDDGFLIQNYDVSEEAVIYSIVDSLTELSGINKVQISVNGSTNMYYREKESLDTFFTRNLDLVDLTDESVNETEVERTGE
jgi:germination protein M